MSFARILFVLKEKETRKNSIKYPIQLVKRPFSAQFSLPSPPLPFPRKNGVLRWTRFIFNIVELFVLFIVFKIVEEYY